MKIENNAKRTTNKTAARRIFNFASNASLWSGRGNIGREKSPGGSPFAQRWFPESPLYERS